MVKNMAAPHTATVTPATGKKTGASPSAHRVVTEVTRPRYRGSVSVWTRAPVTDAVIPLVSPINAPNATAYGRDRACPRATAPTAVMNNAPASPARRAGRGPVLRAAGRRQRLRH
ncbi:hypothetical protein GA0115253_104657 [Streptomyces sp. Termitarium-T10T-6]|nr:hypothetical protein GA0115253_104657 [Streptomyces sp. Termitarium-T10T-6]